MGIIQQIVTWIRRHILRKKKGSPLIEPFRRERGRFFEEPLPKVTRKKQSVSQRYTREKIWGLPSRSARNKRMWKLQVSKEELEED